MLSSPGWLLIVVGALLGLYFPLGRLAREAGVPPLVWAALISVGAAALLLGYLRVRDRPMPLTPRILRYFAVTGVISYAVPNTIIFSAIPHLGSGLTALFLTLSPLMTVALARLAGLAAPSRLEYAGIAFGFAGAALVSLGRGQIGAPAAIGWVLLGLLLPLTLAVGNVYRTLDWPEGIDVAWLAAGSHIVAAALLGAACAAAGASPATLLAAPWLSAGQALTAAVMILLFFRLQVIAGPVTVSQVGTVAAGVGILIGALAFGERYALVVWAGVAAIGAGLALTILARRRLGNTAA